MFASKVIVGRSVEEIASPRTLATLKETIHGGKAVLGGLPQKKRKRGNDEGGAREVKAQRRFTNDQVAVLVNRVVFQALRGNDFTVRTQSPFYQCTTLSLLAIELTTTGKRKYDDLNDAAKCAPEEEKRAMTARVKTFCDTNMGYKWRKWIVAEGYKEADKIKVQNLLMAYYSPQPGMSRSTFSPWFGY